MRSVGRISEAEWLDSTDVVMRQNPYADAPRLPEGDGIDPREVFLPSLPATGAEGDGATAGEDAGAGSVAPAARVDAPIELEIGPGRGWFLIERLEADPAVRMIGLEIKRKWAQIVDERLQKRGLGSRGRVFAEDARLTLPRLSDGCLSVAYVHFPDPWWKKRHNKRLVVTSELLDQLSRLLVPGGELLIQTDVADRADQYEATVAAHAAFEPLEATARVADHPYVARSPRERRAMEDGLPVYRLRYRNVPPASR